MTNAEFVHVQDEILQLSGRELAEKLGVAPSAITLWRKEPDAGGREIPEYIVTLLCYLQKEKLGTMSLTLTVSEISGLIRIAAARGLSFESLLVSLIRKAIAPGAVPFPGTYETPDYTAARKIAEPHCMSSMPSKTPRAIPNLR